MINDKIDFQKHLLIWYLGLCIVSVSVCFYNLSIGVSTFVSFFIALLSVGVPYWRTINEFKKRIEGVESVAMRDGEQILDAIETDLENADEIRMMGTALFRNFFANDRFRKILFNKENQEKFTLKILILKDDRDSKTVHNRAFDEAVGLWFLDKSSMYSIGPSDWEKIEVEKNERIEHIVSIIKNSIVEINKHLRPKLGSKVEVRYITKAQILNSIIIAGSKAVIVDYLHQSGSESPVLIIKNNDTFQTYEREFDRMWVIGEKYDC